MKVHCFFEQSGTFKNEFKKLGISAFDYDILNEFNQTDVIIDLFKEIEKAYNTEQSIFDLINENDLIIAFFPCIRFENQIEMHFRGTASQYKNYTDLQKLEVDLKLHKELSYLYDIITKLAIICIKKNIPLIIENPYSKTHYLTKYWALPAKIIDINRTLRGDFYKKPTQYWFINCEPTYKLTLEAYSWYPKKTISETTNKTARSLISPEYAYRFIKEFIL